MNSLLWVPFLFPTAFVNHLWQSTLFALAIAGLTLLLRRNSARLRFSLWLIASLKFLLPFAVLAAIGTQISWHPAGGEPGPLAPRVVDLAGDISAPMSVDFYPSDFWIGGSQTPWSIAIPPVLLLVWATGVLVVAGRWLWRWNEVRRALRKSVVIAGMDFPAPVRATQRKFEPGVVGIFRPVLLLPAGIETRLTPEQLHAVLAHERCHLRWRDNLTAALHMVVETLFWFHPLVWWIGARLIAERERDCDEQVIRDGHRAENYAEGILQVCEHYIASRLACVSGVSGADLRKRIESILQRTLAVKLDRRKKAILAAAACFAIATPIVAGMLAGNTVQVFTSAYAAGMAEYWQLATANSEQRNAAWMAGNFSHPTCPAPNRAVVQHQQALAATVAKLSAEDGKKVLLFAVAANSAADVQRLLAMGAARAGDGFLGENSLMHIAARFGDPALLETLANAGFAIDNWSGGMGMEGRGSAATETPLTVAIMSGRLDNARWLIQRGADINDTNKGGTTALARAIALCRDQKFVAEMIRAGARPDARALKIAQRLEFDLDLATPKAATTALAPLSEAQLLQQWQRPTAAHLEREPLRRDSPTGYTEVKADFDGDGKDDHAALFVAIDGASEGLLVKLSSRNPDKWLQIAGVRHSAQSTALSMGISPARPGTYVTACGKGYGRCQHDDPHDVYVSHAGIDYFAFESANSIIYWDDSKQAFARVWTSD